MQFKSINTPLLLLASLLIWAAPVLATSPGVGAETRYITLNGQTLELVLVPSDPSRFAIEVNDPSARFYSAQLRNYPQSEGRVAYIGGQWQGLLIHEGELHLIENLDTAPPPSTAPQPVRPAMAVRALQQDMNLGQCGYKTPSDLQSPAPDQQSSFGITARSLMAQSLQIDYDSFCLEQIDGVCLVGELTLVFDDAFEDSFGAQYQAQAVAIAANVDLIYKQNFNIVFNRLRMAFGSGDVFTGGTNIDAVLDDMELKRVAGQTSAFDPNVFSILHFISGRTYFSEANRAVGLALGPTYGTNYASYPNPDIPLLCTGYAIGTSQIIGSGGNRAAFTSLVVAHEIGHNFGFLHDGDDPPASACSATDFIMGPELGSYTSTFSSCSAEVLAPNLNAIATIENCFDFPVDATITTDAGNPEETQKTGVLNTAYAISVQSRSDRSANLRVSGNINSSAATFLDASLDGTPCSLSNSDTTYTCSINGATSHNLDLEIQAALSNLEIVHEVAVISADDFDVTDSNNILTETIAVVDGRSSGTGSRLSGGSGGACNWLGLNLIVLLIIRRFRCS